MIIMILVVIAIFLFLVAIGIYLIIKQKKSEYKDVKKEKIVFSVLVILAIILIIIFFFTQNQSIQTDDGFNSLPEKNYGAAVTLSYANAIECENGFCMEGEVEIVKSGDFSIGQIIIIKSDCVVQTYGRVEVNGEQIDEGIFAQCGDIMDLGIDPLIYEFPSEGIGGPQ